MPVFQPAPPQQSSGSGNVTQKQTEIDFGLIPQYQATFTIIDPIVLPTSNITVTISGATPSGKDSDEVEMDSYAILAVPGNGQFNVSIRGLEGYLHDKFKIVYIVSN